MKIFQIYSVPINYGDGSIGVKIFSTREEAWDYICGQDDDSSVKNIAIKLENDKLYRNTDDGEWVECEHIV